MHLVRVINTLDDDDARQSHIYLQHDAFYLHDGKRQWHGIQEPTHVMLAVIQHQKYTISAATSDHLA